MSDWQIEVFYDGACPLCMREVRMLRRLDRARGRIRFTDIALPEFDARAYDKDHETFMARIQGRTRDGEWIEGVEVFRALYGAVGLEPVMRLTRLPGVRHGLELGYRLFARHRLRLTGRSCDERCEVPAPRSTSTVR